MVFVFGLGLICLIVAFFCFCKGGAYLILILSRKLKFKENIKETLILLGVSIVAMILCVIFISIAWGDDDNKSSKKEYDYVTKSDGTRRWYDPDKFYRVD